MARSKVTSLDSLSFQDINEDAELIPLMTPEDEEKELEFSQENVEVLMKNSSDFDAWVTEQVGDLENFTQSK